jgi:hypothetical protein
LSPGENFVYYELKESIFIEVAVLFVSEEEVLAEGSSLVPENLKGGVFMPAPVILLFFAFVLVSPRDSEPGYVFPDRLIVSDITLLPNQFDLFHEQKSIWICINDGQGSATIFKSANNGPLYRLTGIVVSDYIGLNYKRS